MSRSQPIHHLRPFRRMLALGLSLALGLTLLPGPSALAGQARPATAAPRGKAQGHRAGSRHHHVRHHPHKPKPKPTAGAHAPAMTPALCEDASRPVADGGPPTCADGSEPECADGSTPVASAGGTTLLCPAGGEAAASEPETGCQPEDACATVYEGAPADETTCAGCEHPSADEPEA